MDQDQNPRQKFHELLKKKVGNNVEVYFQPPATIKMKYPCVVYKHSYVVDRYADDIKYSSLPRYDVTVIDRNPDSEIPSLISDLPYCSFDRTFTSDGLYHTVYRVYHSPVFKRS